MASRRVEIGTTGETVRERVRTIRKGQGLTLADVSKRLEAAGRQMGTSTLFDIENGGRRVDVDDLVALAAVLGVSPNTLLMPPASAPDEPIDVAVFGSPQAQQFRRWLLGEAPVQDADLSTVIRFRMASAPVYEGGPRIGSGTVPVDAFNDWWSRSKGSDEGKVGDHGNR